MSKSISRIWTTAALPALILLAATAFAGKTGAHQITSGVSFRVLDISERRYEDANALSVVFSEAISTRVNLDDFIEVSEQTGEGETRVAKGAWVVSDDAKIIYFPYIEAETTYWLTVREDLPSAFGEKLAGPSERQIKTRAVKASVGFESRGNFLPLKLGSGLPVTSVNVSRANIDFHRIRPDAVQQFLKDAPRSATANGWTIDKLAKLGELVYTGIFTWEAAKNKLHRHNIDLRPIKALREPGVYLAVMQPAGSYRGYSFNFSYFSITDLGLHARVYDNGVDVYVSSIESAKPIAGAEVVLHGKDGKPLETGETDSRGLAGFSIETGRVALVTAVKGRYHSHLDMGRSALDLSAHDIKGAKQRNEEMFIWSGRDLYRPGETVEFSMLRRDSDGRPVPPAPVTARIHRSDGLVAAEFAWHGNEMGYYHHRYSLPEGARTGLWTLKLSGGESGTVDFPFKVEDFLPDRMEIVFGDGVAGQMRIETPGDERVNVLGRFLHGSPAAGHRLSARMIAEPAENPVKGYEDYTFGDAANNERIDIANLKDITLGADGRGTLRLPRVWDRIKAPLDISLVASLFETGGRAVKGGFLVSTWPAEAMLGVRLDCECENPPADSEVAFDVVKARRDGTLVAANALVARLVREDRRYFWEYSSHSGWSWQWQDTAYVVAEKRLAAAADGPARLTMAVDYGGYRLEIRDSGDDSLLTSLRFHAGEDWYARWKNQNSATRFASKPDAVSLVLDKGAYEPGDTARVRIVSPHSGEALVTVESDRRLWMKRLYVGADGETVEIPVGSEWRRHDIYISAVVFRGGDARDSISPKRAVGLAHLPLSQQARGLDVKFHLPEKLESGSEQSIEIEVSGADGAVDGKVDGPVYVSLAAVDIGALALTNYPSPDPYTAFLGQRRYSADMHDIYGKIIEIAKYPAATLRAGGDQALARLAGAGRGGALARADVEILSLFVQPVEVDADGRARIKLDIPDYNGRIRLMAVAFGKDIYGWGESEIPVFAPIVMQLSLPRFLAFGDESEAGLSIINRSGRDQRLSVGLEVKGAVRLEGPAPAKVVAIGDEAAVDVTIGLKALARMGSGQIALRVAGEGFAPIELRRRLDVRPPYPAVSYVVNGALAAGERLGLDSVVREAGLVDGSVHTILSVSDQPNVRRAEHLRYLLDYPYGCLEQTTSAAFALAFASPADLGAVAGLAPRDAEARMRTSIDRLVQLRRFSGGFAMWTNGGREMRWLTVHTTDLLLRARQAGHRVPQFLIDGAVLRLGEYARSAGRARSRYRYGRSRRSSSGLMSYNHEFAIRAYAGYVLSTINKISLADLRAIADQYMSESIGSNGNGLSMLYLGLALDNQGDSRRAKEAIDLALAHRIDDSGDSRLDLGNELRDKAMFVHLLLDNGQRIETARGYALELASSLQRKPHLSTQTRRALLAAGYSLSRLEGKPWRAVLKGAADYGEFSNKGSRALKLDSRDLDKSLFVHHQEGGSIYAAISVSGHQEKSPAPVENGLGIARSYYDLNGAPMSPLKLKSGDLMVVGLEITAKSDIANGLIVDLLPAGLEIENVRLSSSAGERWGRAKRSSRLPWNGSAQVQYEELRDDRYVAAFKFGYLDASQFFYVVRAVTPGSYAYPPPLVEDMYRPELRGIGQSPGRLVITAPAPAPGNGTE